MQAVTFDGTGVGDGSTQWISFAARVQAVISGSTAPVFTGSCAAYQGGAPTPGRVSRLTGAGSGAADSAEKTSCDA